MTRAVVYTAIIGGYDTLKQPVAQDEPCDFICFSDMKLPRRVGAWRTVHVARDRYLHPRVQAKWFKLMSHRIFPRGRLAFRHAPFARRPPADLSIWIDGSIRISSRRFVAGMREQLADRDWAMFVHPERDCIYDEAQVCGGMPKYRDVPVFAQVESYRATVPSHAGLYACGVIVRREPAPAPVRAVHDRWWAENLKWTYQDQLSLPYVLRCIGGPEPGLIREPLWKNSWFDVLPHLSDA